MEGIRLDHSSGLQRIRSESHVCVTKLDPIRLPVEGEAEFGFLNSQHKAELLDGGEKDAVLNKLRERWPASTSEAKQLFWQAS